MGPSLIWFDFFKLCQFYFLSFSLSLPKILTPFQVVGNHLDSTVQGCRVSYAAEVNVFANVALVKPAYLPKRRLTILDVWAIAKASFFFK